MTAVAVVRFFGGAWVAVEQVRGVDAVPLGDDLSFCRQLADTGRLTFVWARSSFVQYAGVTHRQPCGNQMPHNTCSRERRLCLAYHQNLRTV